MARAKNNPNYKVIAENRRARYDYAVEDDLECGIILEGSEVKSLRQGQANIAESYASVEDGALWLINAGIAPYAQAKTFGHEERRRRKLLVNRRELARLWSASQREGMTLVPLVLYFNHRGIAKLKIAIAKGKKTVDKRDTQKKRDWQREKARLLRPWRLTGASHAGASRAVRRAGVDVIMPTVPGRLPPRVLAWTRDPVRQHVVPDRFRRMGLPGARPPSRAPGRAPGSAPAARRAPRPMHRVFEPDLVRHAPSERQDRWSKRRGGQRSRSMAAGLNTCPGECRA
jgi:SsrA-binding protein